jgi:hypothetical protein
MSENFSLDSIDNYSDARADSNNLKFGPLILLTLLTLVVATLLLLPHASPNATPVYQGKSLETWFYARRTNFFDQKTRDKAQEAIDSIGTGAVPFLLSNLAERRGDSVLYLKFYQRMPAPIQRRLSYPLSHDDIKSVSLGHIRRMDNWPNADLPRLVNAVGKLENPRLRYAGFSFLKKYQTEPCFQELCRKLVHDPQLGIQLDAAILLGESAIASDPKEPGLFAILITGLESKARRDSIQDVNNYAYQEGHGNSKALKARLRLLHNSDSDYAYDRIRTALYRLEPYLTPEQKKRFRDDLK